MEDIFKCTDNALELLMLEADLSLEVLMFMSMFEVFPTIGLTKVSLSVLGFNVFATSLICKMVVREKEAMSHASYWPRKKWKIK